MTAAGAAAVSGAPSERGAFSGEVMDSLTHTTIPASTPFLPWLTWAVTILFTNNCNIISTLGLFSVKSDRLLVDLFQRPHHTGFAMLVPTDDNDVPYPMT
jgi:hypothetical protein